MSHKEVEDKVLKIYRKVSPSKTRLGTKKNAISFYKTRLNILDTLGLPTQFFKGKKIIDIGGGTGEKSICYALWGSEVTIVEPNEISCNSAKNLFSKLNLQKKLKIINQSLFDFNMDQLKNFDIIICEAVLHHTYDPIHGLNRILENLTEGQVVLIALGEKHGTFKRDLQRQLVKSLAGNNENKTIEISKKYFQEHINRAMRGILRDEKAVIYDNFVNPQDKSSQLEHICNTFLHNDVKYLSAYPKLDLFYTTTPWSQNRVDFFDYSYYKSYYKLLEKIWMTCGEENLLNDLKKFNIKKIIDRIDSDYPKLIQLQKKIKTKSFMANDLGILQKGYMGVGANFFVGFKENTKLMQEFTKISK